MAANTFTQRIKIIDGSQEMDKVTEDIKATMSPLLGIVRLLITLCL